MKEEIKIKDREQLIYDLRRFADESFYLNEINKIGANEIINFLISKLDAPVSSDLTTLRSRVKELEELKAYTHHHVSCCTDKSNIEYYNEHECTCGLNKLLNPTK